MKDLKNVTFETNCTQTHYTDDFKEYLTNNKRLTVTFSCSPKLSVSGESWGDAIKPNIACDYTSVVGSNMYLKFVVADNTDVDEAIKAVEEYAKAGVKVPVYLMPGVGDQKNTTSTYKRWRTSVLKRVAVLPRLHISLFGNAWGT